MTTAGPSPGFLLCYNNKMKQTDLDFDWIYQTYRPAIYRYLTRLVGNQNAEDITQEVFSKISRSLHQFRGDSGVSAWIYRIATNSAMDSIRASGCTTVSFDEADASGWIDGESSSNIESDAIRREMAGCIRETVAELPVGYRAVVVLSELGELSNAEIAEVLGLTVDNVKIRLHRGRTILRKALEAKCTFYRDEQNRLACDRKPALMTLHR